MGMMGHRSTSLVAIQGSVAIESIRDGDGSERRTSKCEESWCSSDNELRPRDLDSCHVGYRGGDVGYPTSATDDREHLSHLIDTRITSIHPDHCQGEFAKMQHEAEEGTRRVRKYLVATDLSDEAAYALEWTIGTILRDGDTLLALYALDEESKGGVAVAGEAVVVVGGMVKPMLLGLE